MSSCSGNFDAEGPLERNLSSSDIDLLREKNQTKLYLAVSHPAIRGTAQVSGNYSQGATTITVTGSTIPAGTGQDFTVLFGTSAGDDSLGYARFRNLTGATLKISPHNAVLSNGNWVTVLNEIYPSTILPRVTFGGVVYEDKTDTWVSVNASYIPLVNMGPPACAFVDPTSGPPAVASIPFYSTSVGVHGATITNWDWQFYGGSPSSSSLEGSSGSPILVDFPVGQYWVSLKVTDSHGITNMGWRQVFVFDKVNNKPYEQLEVSSFEGDASQGGWTVHLKVWSSADETAFPRGAMVVLFAEDKYGDTEKSIGGDYVGRENIVFVGYVRRDTLKKDWAKNWTEFDADGIGKLMNNMLAWPANLKSVASPSKWHELKDMTADLIVHHILTQHSTVHEVTDVVLSTLTYAIQYLDITESDLYDQINNQLLTAVRARLGSSRTGRLYAESVPNLLTHTARTQPVVMDAEFVDIQGEVDLGEELHEYVDAQIDFIGFGYSGADLKPYRCLAPKNQWRSGKVEQIEGVRADTQSEANTLAGIFEGYRNADFLAVIVHWRGNYRVFDVFPAEKVTLTLTALQNNRGIVWTQQVCWHTKVSYDYKPGILLVTSTLERDAIYRKGVTNASAGTDSTPGTTIDPPSVIPVPPPTPGPYPPPGPSPTGGPTYDAGGAYLGTIPAGTVKQGVGLLNGTTWGHYFVLMTGSSDSWTIALNGSTIASGSGSVAWTALSSPQTFANGSGIVFTITATGGSSDLFWGVGV